MVIDFIVPKTTDVSLTMHTLSAAPCNSLNLRGFHNLFRFKGQASRFPHQPYHQLMETVD